MQRTFKFRLYPSRSQEKQMKEHLRMAKDLQNKLLTYSIENYSKTGKFPSKFDLQRLAKGEGLYSQTQQTIAHKVSDSIFRVFKLRKKGIKCGFPRFKSIDRVKSLLYPQFGFKLGNKLKVTPFGEISIKQHRNIEGKVKTLTLKREPSGKWFAIFCVEPERKEPKTNHREKIGLDLGLKTFATLSNGDRIGNPRHLKRYENRLASYQQILSKKKKGSNNRNKAKLNVARIYEKISNARSDFLHKVSTQLVNDYSFIALEKLASREMSKKRFGKQINDAGWNMFANMLRYKAEEAGCKVIFVDPKNTTQMCSCCHQMVEKDLLDRIHDCPSCGLVIDRDHNAAINILNRGLRQIGQELPEFKPLREGTDTDKKLCQQVPLMKEEATCLSW
ncbi:putative transposase [uncultured archaeon]|nr:putative transposase [uncultured archaeon]